MKLHPVYGHQTLIRRLGDALSSGRFPQAVLFSGPRASGKQRLALWAAQGILCEDGPGAPCGECPACRRVQALGHPDLHWFMPIPRPKAGDSKKQVEEVRGLLGDVLEERRQNPFYVQPDGMESHSLASVRLLQQVVAVTPFMGRQKVIILGNAERLIVQEASKEAANALLKVLEEPPRDTVIILTTAEPQALLPTIRSRLVPVRVGRISDDAIRAFLQREVNPPLEGAELERRVLAADGALGRAIASTEEGESAEKAAERVLAAVSAGANQWAVAAMGQAPWGARGKFSAVLDALALQLRNGLRTRAERREPAEGWLQALNRVHQAREEARGNANPQLGLAVLAQDLEKML
jgi:DNA polymerase-3 subunit delta'